MTKLSIKEFKTNLSEGLSEIASNYSWNMDSPTERGYTFQRWCADLLCSYDQGLDTEPEDALLFSKDLGADIILEDSTRKHLIIGQAKYVALKGGLVDETEVNDFFNRHKLYLDRDWVRKHSTEPGFGALGDYRENFDDGYKIEYYFLSTGKSSERINEVVEKINEHYLHQDIDVICRLYDFNGLKDFYVRAQSLEESIPVEIELSLPSQRWFIKEMPHRTLITALKGNALRNLYRQHKEALFAFNIRGYLGDRGINKDITNTAQKRPDDFFYFNNGVSSICTSFDIKDGILKAEKFQVINGAQTIGALGRADPNSDVEVLLRVTETLDVSTEKGINADIILYNNSQNVIKVSDFRSNDPIQKHLETRFKKLKPKGPCPNLTYVRKRGTKRPGTTGRGIKLEDFAKIRYAFKCEPTLVLSSPKDLWSYEKDGGKYEKAFGIDGQIEDVWSDDAFDEAVTAIIIYQKIEEELKADAKRDHDLRLIGRLKYHALSLAGEYIRRTKPEVDFSSLRNNEKTFAKHWDRFWVEAYRTLIDAYTDATEDKKMTPYALSRNAERWETMKKKYLRYARL